MSDNRVQASTVGSLETKTALGNMSASGFLPARPPWDRGGSSGRLLTRTLGGMMDEGGGVARISKGATGHKRWDMGSNKGKWYAANPALRVGEGDGVETFGKGRWPSATGPMMYLPMATPSQIWASSAESNRTRPNSGKTWSISAEAAPTLVELALSSAEVGRHLADSKPDWAQIGQNSSRIGRTRPTNGQSWSILGQVWPTSAELGPTSAPQKSNLFDSGPIWAMSVESVDLPTAQS